MELEPIEGPELELKAAFSWNQRTGSEDANLRLGTARTIAAFANTAGGQLRIGYDDHGNAVGIEQELRALFDHDFLDQFEQLLHEYLKRTLFPYPFRAYDVSFRKAHESWVCTIDVKPVPTVTYVCQKDDAGELKHLVFVRTGNRTITLTNLERDRYVVERNGGKWAL